MAYTTIDDPSAHFHTQLYTGNGSSGLQVRNNANAGDFTPDWLWLKPRSLSDNHTIFDSSRGFDRQLKTNGTDAEDTHSPARITRETNGFDVDSTDQNYNQSSATYVAWQWKANGGSRTTFTESGSNPGGGYQANTTAGFSIVDYTGTGSAGTVQHGLGKVPHWILIKGREHVGGWINYHQQNTTDPKTDILELQSTAAAYDNSTYWNDTAPTSSVFTVNTSNDTNKDGAGLIAYVFTSIKGFSKMGGYRGNSNADGTFVYTGFKPAFMMFKKYSAVDSWGIFDNKRNTNGKGNPRDIYLVPNAQNSDSSSSVSVDFLSNGFKWRIDSGFRNESGQNYVYMAFAENPFVSSEGVPTTAS